MSDELCWCGQDARVTHVHHGPNPSTATGYGIRLDSLATCHHVFPCTCGLLTITQERDRYRLALEEIARAGDERMGASAGVALLGRHALRALSALREGQEGKEQKSDSVSAATQGKPTTKKGETP